MPREPPVISAVLAASDSFTPALVISKPYRSRHGHANYASPNLDLVSDSGIVWSKVIGGQSEDSRLDRPYPSWADFRRLWAEWIPAFHPAAAHAAQRRPHVFHRDD